MPYTKKYLTIICGTLMALTTGLYAAEGDLLVNIQFSTSANVYDDKPVTDAAPAPEATKTDATKPATAKPDATATAAKTDAKTDAKPAAAKPDATATKADAKPAAKAETPNTFITHFADKGVLPGGTYWNLVQPKEASPNKQYEVGEIPLIGTFALKDAKEAPTKLSVTIGEGSMILTKLAQDTEATGTHFFPAGYSGLLNSGLIGLPNGSLVIGGLTPAQSYTLVFYGHPLGYLDTKCGEGLSITINDVTKNSDAFDFKVARELKEGVDYLTFKNITPDATGNLTVTFSGYDTVQAKQIGGGWLSAMQIQASSKTAAADTKPDAKPKAK